MVILYLLKYIFVKMSYIHIIIAVLIFSWLNFSNASNLPPVDLPALPPKAMPSETVAPETSAQTLDKQPANQQEIKQEESNKQQDDDTAIDWKKVSLPQEMQQIQQKDPASDAATANSLSDTSVKDGPRENLKPADPPSQATPESNALQIPTPPSSNTNNLKPETNQKHGANPIKANPPHMEAQFMNKSANELNGLVDNIGTSPEQAKFISDESKMLLLPDDDVVLGKLSEDTIIEQMNFEDYLHLFAKSEQWYKDTPQRESINHFVANYDKKFNTVPVMSNQDAQDNAFLAVTSGNLFALRALADNFSVLDKVDDNGNSLLHAAASYNNERIVEFLVIRGANISKRNFMWKTALDIASGESDERIIRILRKASGK